LNISSMALNISIVSSIIKEEGSRHECSFNMLRRWEG